ncbi:MULTISPECIES: winged helix-turn-helix domain-containing protein [unclassified Halorhabdus]|uniref:winged helix-turn-helix domain-containing protein n=1 Tax=unclassified Halorhabdus TaxID=2621901 RepID=UPI0023D9F8FD|nr:MULTISPECIES: winged helix-turn-helix domain-containing protein [unclassified Halorhabdus]WEL16574.1 Transcriptional regulator containing HTH domain,ArsR family [Halorhabdus sp. SVX81]WEL20453.1 Transcriptional regulator containing HTH domain,ArsR family [Halorhabdus sp. BNX81]
MSGDSETAELLALLEDEYAREILTATSAQPMSAERLSQHCDASDSTIYRRVDRLKNHDLIDEQTQFDPDGHHYSVYISCLESVTVSFEDGECRIELERRRPAEEDPADRFTRMWQDL